MKIKSINPATGEVLDEFSELSKQQLSDILNKSCIAYHQWKKTSFSDRKNLLKKVSEILRKEREYYSKLITKEMEKPIRQAKAEVDKCAWVCDFYAYHGERFLLTEDVETDAEQSVIRYKPIGVVLAIMPWNFPFWQVFRCAAPVIMAGNTMVLKHSSNVPQCSLAIEGVFAAAGFPCDVFHSMLIGADLARGIITDDRIAAVSLTGSTAAGCTIASEAGKQIKKVVLELGGNDPFIVLNDANLDFTIPKAVFARTQNNGQSCIAAKRFIIQSKIYKKFTKKLIEHVTQLNMGNPMLTTCEIGPLIQPDAVSLLDNQVKQSIGKGAQLLYGGNYRSDSPGFFYPPTILSNVKKGMAVYDEETFGPVFALIKVNSDDEAVKIANDTIYGLGASIWSSSIEHARHIGNQLENGNVFINEIVKSDPRLPFGGIKKSGFGRKLSQIGIREFVNIQTMYTHKQE